VPNVKLRRDADLYVIDDDHTPPPADQESLPWSTDANRIDEGQRIPFLHPSSGPVDAVMFPCCERDCEGAWPWAKVVERAAPGNDRWGYSVLRFKRRPPSRGGPDENLYFRNGPRPGENASAGRF
jgi:hypothetical protein